MVADLIKQGFDVFIDSSAFSAENSGVEIDLKDYMQFLRDVDAITYAGLDVIGSHEKTMENQRIMEAEGFKPIPTFHVGSDLTQLDEILDYPYIALGGLVSADNIKPYLDKVWAYIMKKSPKKRVHGFGVTNIELMARYPWFSVDSISHKSCKMYGRQQILWGGLNFKTFQEDDYINHLTRMGYVGVDKMSNNEKWHIYDYYSLEAFKIYAAHLTEVNKIRKWEHLTDQLELF